MEVSGVASQPGALAKNAAAVSQTAGSLGGLAVQKAPTMSQLLADLQEEISFAHAERAESEEEAEEALEDRANRVREKLIERIRDVYKAADSSNEQANSRQEMLEKLKAGHYKSPDDLLEDLGQRTGDRAEIFHLLTAAGDELEPGSAAAELVNDALIAAASDWEHEIVAGSNTFESSAEAAARTGLEQDELQRAYQDTIVSYESVISTLAELTAKFGLDRVEDGADFLQEAARADLISQPSSVEPERLERTLLELQGMKIYHTFQENIDTAYERARRRRRAPRPARARLGDEPLHPGAQRSERFRHQLQAPGAGRCAHRCKGAVSAGPEGRHFRDSRSTISPSAARIGRCRRGRPRSTG